MVDSPNLGWEAPCAHGAEASGEQWDPPTSLVVRSRVRVGCVCVCTWEEHVCTYMCVHTCLWAHACICAHVCARVCVWRGLALVGRGEWLQTHTKDASSNSLAHLSRAGEWNRWSQDRPSPCGVGRASGRSPVDPGRRSPGGSRASLGEPLGCPSKKDFSHPRQAWEPREEKSGE